ncbi:Fur family transcriptional regulator [Bacteroides sedimenti]|uniref:Transcriptional regulator n=1 Tax=Bacteroides sedimenti TaxID=2136147 RepID=A0ABN6Z0X7_9BACE
MNSDFEKILENRGIKPTAMRILVLKELHSQSEAMSIYDLEQKFNKVERTTLFRTLNTFEENNLIHKIDDGSGAVKYALCQENCTCKLEDLHVHFLCMKCKKTFCLENIPVPFVQLPDNFEFKTANFVIKGICPQCHK